MRADYTHNERRMKRVCLTTNAGACYGCRVVMQSGLRFNLIRLSRLRRGLAIFLLAFAFFDLTVVDMFSPELCGDEHASLSFASPVESTEEIGALTTHDSQPVQDSHQSPIDEDCFCCCSHIIPGVCIKVAVLNGSPQPGASTITSLPSSPPRDAFHPPRLS